MNKKITKLSATWCAPCKQYAPIFDSLKEQMIQNNWEINLLDVDTDEGKNIAQNFGVRGVPATIIEINGETPIVKMGVLSIAELSIFLEK